MKAYSFLHFAIVSLLLLPIFTTNVRPAIGSTNFTLSAPPVPLSVLPGTESRIAITISATSPGTFGDGGPCVTSGLQQWQNVGLYAVVSPNILTGPTANLNPDCVHLDSSGNADSILAVLTSSSTPLGNYTLHVWVFPPTCPYCAQPPPEEAGALLVIVTNNAVRVDNVSFFSGTRTTIEGNIFQSSIGNTILGSVNVMTMNSSNGMLLFQRTFTVSLPLGNAHTARFVLAVPTDSQRLGVTCSIATNPFSEICFVTKNPGIIGEGTVGLVDVGIVFAAFGSTIGSARYQPAADLDDNGKIDMIDAGIIAADFGAPILT